MKKIRKIKNILFNYIKINIKNNNISWNEIQSYNDDYLEFIEIIKQYSEKNKNIIIKDSNKILKNYIDIYGKELHISDKINYKSDIINKKVYSGVYYKFIRAYKYYGKADIKNVWELSNLRELVTLAQATYLTGEYRYFEFAIKRLEEFLKQDSKCYKIGSSCPMEVALRSINLVIAFLLFEESGFKVESKFKRYIIICGENIFNNLEKNEISNNHYISNLIGLLFITKYMKGYKESKRWLLYVYEELCNEIKIQINEDGSSFEGSTSYHLYVLELLLYGYIINKNSFNSNYKGILINMITFLKNIECNNVIPLFGDNDSSRVLFLDGYFNKNYTNTKSISFIINKIGISNIEQKYSYNNSGYYILENNIYKSIIKCGTIGSLTKGTHDHNDQLSFILNIKNIPIVVDPGNVTYTLNLYERNYFRNTENHNTIYLDNIQQNYFKSIFSIATNRSGRKVKFGDDEFCGRFCYEDNLLNLERSFYLKNNIFKIQNIVKSQYLAKGTLVLDNGIKVVDKKDSFLVISKDDIIVKIKFIGEIKYSLDNMFISKTYSKKIETKRINLFNIGCNSEIIFEYIDKGYICE